jgi:hypothetical protein
MEKGGVIGRRGASIGGCFRSDPNSANDGNCPSPFLLGEKGRSRAGTPHATNVCVDIRSADMDMNVLCNLSRLERR